MFIAASRFFHWKVFWICKND